MCIRDSIRVTVQRNEVDGIILEIENIVECNEIGPATLRDEFDWREKYIRKALTTSRNTLFSVEKYTDRLHRQKNNSAGLQEYSK